MSLKVLSMIFVICQEFIKCLVSLRSINWLEPQRNGSRHPWSVRLFCILLWGQRKSKCWDLFKENKGSAQWKAAHIVLYSLSLCSHISSHPLLSLPEWFRHWQSPAVCHSTHQHLLLCCKIWVWVPRARRSTGSQWRNIQFFSPSLSPVKAGF